QHLVHGALLKLRRNWRKDEDRSVARVPQIACSREWNPDRVVVAGKVIAHLDLAGHDSNHFETDAADQHRFADSRTPAEELLATVAAEKAHPPPLQFVGGVEPAALGWNLVAHLAVFRANSANGRRSHHAVLIGDARPTHGLAADILHQRGGGFHHIHIRLLQHDLLSGALAAGLFAGLPRPGDHNALS